MDEEKRNRKDFIDPVTTSGILALILQPVIQAIISFFTLKILQVWWDKYGKSKWNKIREKFGNKGESSG